MHNQNATTELLALHRGDQMRRDLYCTYVVAVQSWPRNSCTCRAAPSWWLAAIKSRTLALMLVLHKRASLYAAPPITYVDKITFWRPPSLVRCVIGLLKAGKLR